MAYSIIQKSQLEGALRLDAEYYQSEKLNFLKLLEIKGWKQIGDEFEIVNDIFDPKRDKLDKPTCVFDLPDIQNCLLEIKSPIKDISEIGSTKKIFEKGDVIISRLRPYLREVTYVGLNENFKLGSTEFIVLRKKENIFYYPQTLFVFLITKPVQTILFQSMGGAEHPRFQEKIILDIYLPKISSTLNEEIKNLVDNAYHFHISSNFLYSQAENLLLEELGLKDFKIEDDLSYIINLSEIKSAQRADAEHFQPKYEKLLNKIRDKTKICILKEIATVKRGSLIDPKFYDELQGTPYIRGKDFSSGRLEKTDLVYINQEFKPKRETRVKTGDIVFASIGSVGTTALVSEEFNNSFISNNTGKISINDKENLLPEYLVIVFHSIVGKLQFEKEASQTAQPKISDSQIKNFKIPILPKPTQEKIADLVQKSHEARKKAKQLLEKAKQKVEEIIEK